jgi:SulP family sulfate permease
MIVVYGVLSKHGIDGLIISTILAGFILMLMGIFNFGKIIKFIPYPIVTGFTSGIALTIFSTQIKDFFGLSIKTVPSEFIHKWQSYIFNIESIDLTTTSIGIISLIIIMFWPKVNKKIPGALIALIVTTSIAYFLKLDIETIGSKYGEISSSFPMLSIPSMNFSDIKYLIQPAFTIALLGGIESLLSATVADGMIGAKHRPNTELIGQGMANIASGLFGGIPATGAIARTAANIKNGGRTPIAGIVHSIVLLFIMLVFMPYAKLIPLSSLAAILIVVAYNMSEWREFKNLLSSPKSDIFVLLTAFVLTEIVDLVVAIEVGIVLASLLFMKRMSDVSNVQNVSKDISKDNDISNISDDTLVYDINGPLFFGAADKFTESIIRVQGKTNVIILKMNNVPAMDATASHALEALYEKCKLNNINLILYGLQSQPYSVLKKSGFINKIGINNICKTIDEALIKPA